MEKKFNYVWIMIPLCFLIVCTGLGFCAGGKNMYLTAITDALGFKRSAFALNDTFRYVTTAVINIFIGSLINKFGIKKLVSFGFISLIGFCLIRATAESLFLFYVAGILLGLGLSFSGTAMISIIVNNWCKKNRGTVMGAILAANGLGGAFASQILSPIIFEEGNAFGYRNSYKLVAFVLFIVLVLIIVFFRERPKGAEREFVPKKRIKKARGAGWVGMDFAEAKKKVYFYIALVCMTMTGMMLQALSAVVTPHMYDMGLEKSFVANVLTISSIALMFSKFIVGFLYDRYGIKVIMNFSYVASFLSILGAVLISTTPFGKAVAIIRVFFGAIALPLETVMIPLFASELFGNKSFAKIVGIFSAATTAGMAFASTLANLCYDIMGNYNFAFYVIAGMMLFVAVTMQFVLRCANRDRKIIEERKNQNISCIV